MFAKTVQLFLPFFETKQEMQVLVSGFALLESSNEVTSRPQCSFHFSAARGMVCVDMPGRGVHSFSADICVPSLRY